MIRTTLTSDHRNSLVRLSEEDEGNQVDVIACNINGYSEGEVNIDKALTHLAIEAVFEKDWLTTQEDEAWKNV